MWLKSLSILSFVLITSCVKDDDAQRIEKWHLHRYEGSGRCLLSLDSIPEEPNYIIENLLGLEDSTVTDIELHLGDNGEMKMLKNNQVALSGNWKNLDGHVLTLTANGQLWNLEVADKGDDSIVLKSDGYQYMQDLEIVLKH
jgi:hypothetical protein